MDATPPHTLQQRTNRSLMPPLVAPHHPQHQRQYNPHPSAHQPAPDLQHVADEAYPFVVVRALYPYQPNNSTTISLPFQKDDLIQVVAQLESGWWYGFCNDARGWFPSNFVEEIVQADIDDDDDDNTSDRESSGEEVGDDLWLPQTAVDGQVFYFNTRTGDSSWSIPSSTPSARAELVQNDTRAPFNTTNTSNNNNTHTISSSVSSAASQGTPSERHQRTDSAHSIVASVPPIRRENSIASSSRSSLLTTGTRENQDLDQTVNNPRASSSAHEAGESDSRGESTRPNSWLASTVPTRAGSPISQDDSSISNQSHLGSVRKPSNVIYTPSASVDQVEGLPPLPVVSNPFESEPTWNSLAAHASSTLQNLTQSVDHGYKAYYQVQAAQVVESVRVVFYASGTIDQDDAPIRMHPGLKVHHRRIMAALSRLVLSAKMASSVWPADSAVTKMRLDIDDVSNSVHQFITTAQQAGLTVHDVDAKLILESEGSVDSKQGQKLARTTPSTPRASSENGDKSTYRRSLGSAGIVSQLDYYCKSACKAIGLLNGHISKVLENPLVVGSTTVEKGGSRPSVSSSSIMNSAQSSQLVTHCQQSLSHIGSLLALVSEFYGDVLSDHPTIKDHIFLDVRVSKQALYNNVAALVMAVQLATDPMAQTTVLEMALEAVQSAERSVSDLTAATRSLATANDDAAEKHVRARVMSDASSTLVGQMSYVGMSRQSEIDGYFLDQDSDLDADTVKSSRYRSDSRPSSSFSSNSSISGFSTSTGQGTEYTNSTNLNALSPTGSSAPMDFNDFNAPTAIRSSTFQRQKINTRGSKLRKMLGDDVPTPKPSYATETPWFLGHDYSQSDISFNMEGHVRGGTLPALVERLTLHDGLDVNFVATFLLTYRSFCTSKQFFSLLFRRVAVTPPPGLDHAELRVWSEKKLTPIRLRVFNIIKSWLENYYLEDEPEDRQVLPRIKEFAESTLMRESMNFAAVQLTKLVDKRETSDKCFRKMVLNLTTQAPQPITPRNLKKIKFMELDPLEFARQLTIMEAACYNKIKPNECLAKAWTSEDPEISRKASNIKKMIETSNLYSNWINEVVLSERDIKKRAAIIKQLIYVAERLRQLNNFSMLSATTAALAQSPIHRLKRTWELIPTRNMTLYATLQAVTSAARNWADYRQELHSANPPCVPFVGVYLTDLVMIQDGNPDVIKGSEHHINFYKRVSTAEVIREIQQYQSVPYCLTSVREIQAFIRRGMDHARDVPELYEMSLELEPREGEEEKITRLLSESGLLDL